jgi:hypothetical protein
VLDRVLTREVVLAGLGCTELLAKGDLLRPWEDDEGEPSMRMSVRWTAVEPVRLALSTTLSRWPSRAGRPIRRRSSRLVRRSTRSRCTSRAPESSASASDSTFSAGTSATASGRARPEDVTARLPRPSPSSAGDPLLPLLNPSARRPILDTGPMLLAYVAVGGRPSRTTSAAPPGEVSGLECTIPSSGCSLH